MEKISEFREILRGAKNILQTLERLTASRTCTAAAFIPTRRPKNSGAFGAEIFFIIATTCRPVTFTENFWSLCATRIILC